ncbi:MAG: methyltransferase domain-containing protein [Chloracidobacterium sp.]|nr:methyltransferase domain-containing protein [Chloracidobacterium sp.]
MSKSEAEGQIGGRLYARPDLENARGGMSKAAGVTDTVMLRADLAAAFPVIDDIPILLAPEILAPVGKELIFDLTDPRFAEAYEEMDFYNARAEKSVEMVQNHGAISVLPTEMAATDDEKRIFPRPGARWIDAVHDLAAQWDSYEFLSPVRGKKLLQLGGSGTHALKFAMAGAEEVWLATPMAGEALFAKVLAESAGFGDRFRSVVAIAEELPFGDNFFDGIFPAAAAPYADRGGFAGKAARVLRDGGRFAAAEPWRAPLYGLGTKIMGKREDAYCRPLDARRLAPSWRPFSEVRIIHHGAVTRYPLIALEKLGLKVPKALPWYLGKGDDAVASLIPPIRRMGSSIAVLAKK